MSVFKRILRAAFPVLLLFLSSHLHGQRFSAGINTENPNPNAVLHLKSGDDGRGRGLLIPALSTNQRNTLGSSLGETDNGLLVYDSVANAFFFWVNPSWIQTTNTDEQDLADVLSRNNDAGGLLIENVADPVNPQDVATKNYVDNLPSTDNQDLTLTGNTLSLTNDPTSIDLSPYLDNTDDQNLSSVLAFGNDAGAITITNLPTPVNPADAATKAYVDSNGGNQNLTLSGSDLSIDNGNTVDLSALAVAGDVTGDLSNSIISSVGGASAADVATATLIVNSNPNLDTDNTDDLDLTAVPNVAGDISGDFGSGLFVDFVGGVSAADVSTATATVLSNPNIDLNFTDDLDLTTVPDAAGDISGDFGGGLFVDFVGGASAIDVSTATTTVLSNPNIDLNFTDDLDLTTTPNAAGDISGDFGSGLLVDFVGGESAADVGTATSTIISNPNIDLNFTDDLDLSTVPNAAGDISGDFGTGLTIDPNAVGAAEIADNTVGTAELAPNAVTTTEIANGTVADADLDKTNIPLSGFGAATASVDAGNQLISNIAPPVAATDAATKGYVDGLSTLPAMADAQIIVSSGATPTAVAMTGDVTIDNTGLTAIGANAVTGAEILDATVGNIDLDKTNIPLSGFGAATASVDAGNQLISNIAPPVAATDAATKGYVDGLSTLPVMADAQIIVSSGATPTAVAMTGDVTIDNTGLTAIGANAVTGAEILDATVGNLDLDKTNIPLSGFGAATASVDAGNQLISNIAPPVAATDAATKGYVDGLSTLPAMADAQIIVSSGVTPTAVAMTGDVTIDNTGLTAIGANAVTGAEILDATIGNLDLDKTNIPLSGFGAATASVDAGNQLISNIAPPVAATDAATKGYVDGLSTLPAMADAQIIVSSGATPTAVAMTGDVTIDNTGLTAIGANAVGAAEIADNTVGTAELAPNAVTTTEIANGTVADADLDKTNIPLSGFGAATASVDAGNQLISNIAPPVAATDAATKGYVDGLSTLPAMADAQIIVSSGATPTAVAMTGDVTIDNTGLTAIGANAVTGAEILDATVGNLDLDKTNIPLSGFGAATASVDAGNQLISNVAPPVTPTDAVNRGYVDGLSTLPAMADAQIIVSSGAIPASVDMTGDVTIDNTGLTTIGGNAVDDAKVEDDITINTADDQFTLFDDTNTGNTATLELGILSAPRVYTLPDLSGILALQSDLGSFIDGSENNIAGNSIASPSGSNNIVFGFNSGPSMTTGSDNIVIGTAADNTAATTGGNISIGVSADGNGGDAIAIGTTAQADAVSSVAIGKNAVATNANTFIVGGTGVDALSVGIGTSSPAATLDIVATDAMIIPAGLTGERPGTPVAGMMRFNSTDGLFEGNVDGSVGGWRKLGFELPFSATLSNTSSLFDLEQTGSAAAGRFQVNNGANAVPALEALSNGTAGALAFRAFGNGAAGAGEFEVDGSATALQVANTGTSTGMLASFQNNSGSNTSSVVDINTVGTGSALEILHNAVNGNGIRVDMSSNSADPAVEIVNSNGPSLISDGSIGIGTANPSYDISVYNTLDQGKVIGLDAQGTQANQLGAFIIHTLGDGTTQIDQAGTNGWMMTGFGDAFADATKQNDLAFGYYNGATETPSILFLDHNGAIGIGTGDPAVTLDIVGTDAIRIPRGNDAARPTGLIATDAGLFRYSDEPGAEGFEGFDGSAWQKIGGAITGTANRIPKFNASGDGLADSDLFGNGVNNQLTVQHTATSIADFVIHDAGLGDASMQFNRGGAAFFAVGIDYDDADNFKISSATDVSANEFVIERTTGNVGLGIGDPGRELHLHNGAGGISFQMTNSSSGGTGVNNGFVVDYNTSDFVVDFRHYENEDMAFGNAGTRHLYLDNSLGRVGIGTSTPGAALDVNGITNVSGDLNINGTNIVLSSTGGITATGAINANPASVTAGFYQVNGSTVINASSDFFGNNISGNGLVINGLARTDRLSSTVTVQSAPPTVAGQSPPSRIIRFTSTFGITAGWYDVVQEGEEMILINDTGGVFPIQEAGNVITGGGDYFLQSQRAVKIIFAGSVWRIMDQ